MTNLNEIELETVAGGIPFLALPAMVIVIAQMAETEALAAE